MTHSLLLLLKGPMQSWDDTSRSTTRATRPVPTKSGVLGMVAAAQGRRRTDSVEDLARLTFAVRVDQPGTLLRDYQTAQSWQKRAVETTLITRYYLQDAVFTAAIQCDDRGLLEGVEMALRSPRFPLFLGRRSCPANYDLCIGIRDTDAVTALRAEDWHASAAHQRSRSRDVTLPIYRDALPGESGDPRQDVPVSFDSENRVYGWRAVVQDDEGALVENMKSTQTDPFFEAVIGA